MRLVAHDLQFPEGPVFLPDGRLLVTEIARECVTVIDPDDCHILGRIPCPGGPNGAALSPDGAIYICNNGGTEWHCRGGLLMPGPPAAGYAGGVLQRLDLATARIETVHNSCDGARLSAPNDLVFDAAGGIWFTDTGKQHARHRDHGGVCYASAEGEIRQVLYPLLTPNGIGLSPDGKELYVAETATGRIWAWPVTAPGTLGRGGKGPCGGRLVHGFAGYQLLDSLAIDGDGNICVATLVTGAVSVVTPDGRLLRQVAPPEHDPLITNICFGGPDLRTAFITSSGRGRVWAVDWPSPGHAPHFTRSV